MKFISVQALSFAAFVLLAATVKAQAADILFIGDSHSYGCFGETFESSLRETVDPASKAKLSVRSTATCGSSVASWLTPSGHDTTCGLRACETDGTCQKRKKGHSDSILTKLKEDRPRLTIIALGSNMLKMKNTDMMSDVEKVIRQIKTFGSECLWVGPPQPARFYQTEAAYEKFNNSLKLAIETQGCRFISSEDKTARENLKDRLGLHYDCNRATAWGKKVATEAAPVIANLLATPPKSQRQTPAKM